jgi:subtilase family serine protease
VEDTFMKPTHLIALGILVLWAAQPAGRSGAAPQKPVLVTGPINAARLVTLAGNTRPEATPANDRGALPAKFRLDHMFLLLRRPAASETALEKYLHDLTDPHSPNFHHWLTAAHYGEQYGLAPEDIGTIIQWLSSYGFVVNEVYPNGVVIDFSGTVGQVRAAFHTEIHQLMVKGVKHIANMNDPRIPAALAPAIVGVVSLNDFMPKPLHRMRPQYTFSSSCGLSSTCYALVPADLETIYNFNPAFAAGFSGQGQTVVVVEDTDVYSTGDWDTFRSTFGLTAAYPEGSFTQIHPPSSGTNNCTDPGSNADDGEAILDAEWASAAAPSAAIVLASCADTTNFGGFIATENLLNASGSPPAIISISYGDAETDMGASENAYVNSLYQQAAAEGVSVFVASGDSGADVEDPNTSYATHGINVSGFASTPYNVAVGGTDFGDTYAGTNSTYWNASNFSSYGSALSYIPEIPWNDSCASALIASHFAYPMTYGSAGFCNSITGANYLTVEGGSGGLSGCATGSPSTSGVVSGTCAGYAKPSWQSVFGVPNDNVRDLPDVSLFAANGAWGHYYVFCWSDHSQGGKSCNGAPDTWAGGGGTSFAAPIMAGVQALVNQAAGASAGNPNPLYYSLASTEYGASGKASCNSTLGNGAASSCIFYDITQGDMDIPCTGTHNCYLPSGTYGVLSTSNSSYQPAYGTQTGWDFATGIGSINVSNLVNALAGGEVSGLPSRLDFSLQVLGTASGTKSVTVTNSGLATLSITGVSVLGANGADFNLTDGCSSTLAAGSSCLLQVSFQPAASGPRKAYIALSDSAASSPQIIVVTGLGTALSLSPAGLTFTGQTVGTPSSPQAVTLHNMGTATINLWQIAILGTNPADFLSNSTCGTTLAASGSCTVNVTFKPTATGARTASLLFSDDAGGSPQAVTLSGTGN